MPIVFRYKTPARPTDAADSGRRAPRRSPRRHRSRCTATDPEPHPVGERQAVANEVIHRPGGRPSACGSRPRSSPAPVRALSPAGRCRRRLTRPLRAQPASPSALSLKNSAACDSVDTQLRQSGQVAAGCSNRRVRLAAVSSRSPALKIVVVLLHSLRQDRPRPSD